MGEGGFHCAMFTFCWVILNIVMIVLAGVLRRVFKYWRLPHMLIGIFLTGCSLVYPGDSESLHTQFVYILTVIVILCTVSGILSNIQFMFPKKRLPTKLLVILKVIHKCVGYMTSAIGLISVNIGYTEHSTQSTLAFLICYPLFGLAFIVPLILVRRHLSKCSKGREEMLNENRLQTEGFAYVQEEIDRGRKLMLFDDIVFEGDQGIEGFHPFNGEMWKDILGADVRKYLLGGFQYHSLSLAHPKARSLKLIHQRTIGRLPSSAPNMFLKSEGEGYKEFSIFSEREQIVGDTHSEWKLGVREKVTELVATLKFSTPDVKVRSLLPGTAHFGQYYVIRSEENDKERNYSLCFALEADMYQRHLTYGREVQEGNFGAEGGQPDILSLLVDYITIFVRKFGGFSTYLHTTPLLAHTFKIAGPFGPGLQISPQQNGTIVGMGMGIGSIIFVDLVAYLIRMVGFRKSSHPMFQNEEYSAFAQPGFKFVLFLAFKKKSHVIGQELFELLADLCKETEMFRFYMRISENGDPRFSPQYFKDKVGDPAQVAKVILPNLPFSQQKDLFGIFTEFGVPKEKFIIS